MRHLKKRIPKLMMLKEFIHLRISLFQFFPFIKLLYLSKPLISLSACTRVLMYIKIFLNRQIQTGKAKDPSENQRTPLVQTTLSSLFKKVEDKVMFLIPSLAYCPYKIIPLRKTSSGHHRFVLWILLKLMSDQITLDVLNANIFFSHVWYYQQSYSSR